ncbi:phage baseplate assembly protein V [Pseudomonas asiatica]|uniref:Phage baseplate assembly protein V n=1 Tax=Pseudomonas asiatica TaxID=2219225 RepID=A0A9X4CZK3_9PSED|nr:phage baseplate assembly protein V [Pseudomonas asiatica]MDD2105717.1 phage baseplate assembly protein V [Pseudomonas asiatica]
MGVELEYGEVSAIDYLTCRIRVHLDDRDGVESYWLNVPQRNSQGTKSRPLMPELGEQVAVLLDADGVGGVYLGGVYSTAEPPPVVDESTAYIRYRDGTVVAYDCDAGVMTLENVGDLLVKCGRGVTVSAGEPVLVKAPSAVLEIPEVELKGNLKVDGNIDATGTIMDVGGNSNHHSH